MTYVTKLDDALEKYIEDEKAQAPYYDLILNSNFCVPTHAEEGVVGEQELTEDSEIVPLILSAEGDDYMMLFENAERLTAWAKEEVSYVVLPGDLLARMTPPALYWALNMGTEYSKQFEPDEIAWLRQIVEQYEEMSEEQPAEEN
jgi:hypothetical protein